MTQMLVPNESEHVSNHDIYSVMSLDIGDTIISQTKTSTKS